MHNCKHRHKIEYEAFDIALDLVESSLNDCLCIDEKKIHLMILDRHTAGIQFALRRASDVTDIVVIREYHHDSLEMFILLTVLVHEITHCVNGISEKEAHAWTKRIMKRVFIYDKKTKRMLTYKSIERYK